MAHRLGARLAVVVLLLAALTGCGATVGESGHELRVLVPSEAGGGYDLTARSAAQVWRADGAAPVDVFNLTGGGGVTGLNRVVLEAGNPDLLLMMGLSMVGALQAQPSRHGLEDATPIAKLLEEPQGILVAADSPLAGFADFAEALAADPAALRLGGGSVVGGSDHLVALQVAEALGVPRAAVDYRVYEGGGELLPALLAGWIDVAVTGVSEYLDQIRSGSVRVLAVTGDRRADVVDAPTLLELGWGVTAVNWRGLYAPPGLDAGQVQRLVDLAEALRDSPRWHAALRRNGWSDAYLAGDDFARYVRQQQAFVVGILDPGR